MNFSLGFKKNFISEPIHVKDVYNLLCLASGQQPGRNEGDIKFVAEFMESELAVVSSNLSATLNETVVNMSIDTGLNTTDLLMEGILQSTTEGTTVLLKIGTTSQTTSGENETLVYLNQTTNNATNESSIIELFGEHLNLTATVPVINVTAEPDLKFTVKTTPVTVTADIEVSGSGDFDTGSGFSDRDLTGYSSKFITKHVDQTDISGDGEECSGHREGLKPDHESSGATDDKDTGSGFTHETESSGVLAEGSGSFASDHLPKFLDDLGHFEFDTDTINDDHLDPFPTKFKFQGLVDDEQLMELNPSAARKFSDVVLHMSLVERNHRIIEKISEGQTKQIDVSLPSQSDGKALVNVNEYNVLPKGSMSKTHISHPKIVLKFN